MEEYLETEKKDKKKNFAFGYEKKKFKPTIATELGVKDLTPEQYSMMNKSAMNKSTLNKSPRSNMNLNIKIEIDDKKDDTKITDAVEADEKKSENEQESTNDLMCELDITINEDDDHEKLEIYEKDDYEEKINEFSEKYGMI